MPLHQTIRFCTAHDGVRLAYATSGSGPPLVKAGNWMSHLEFDLRSPVWGHLVDMLSRDYTVVRYDQRGTGLSDWDVDDISFEAWVRDLEGQNLTLSPAGSLAAHISMPGRRGAQGRDLAQIGQIGEPRTGVAATTPS